jgi:hypothetical protein
MRVAFGGQQLSSKAAELFVDRNSEARPEQVAVLGRECTEFRPDKGNDRMGQFGPAAGDSQ